MGPTFLLVTEGHWDVLTGSGAGLGDSGTAKLLLTLPFPSSLFREWSTIIVLDHGKGRVVPALCGVWLEEELILPMEPETQGEATGSKPSWENLRHTHF